MQSADTNVLVRLIARDDPRQTAAAEAFVRSGVWVSHLVLAEAVWMLESIYGLQPPQILGALDTLVNHASLTLQDSDAVMAAAALFRARPAVGFADCLVLEIARKAGHLPVATFDRDFAKLADVQRIA